jgi:hypothetical protein
VLVRSIFQNELHLDPQKLSVAQLNARLEARGTLPKRKMQIKATLFAAGMLEE